MSAKVTIWCDVCGAAFSWSASLGQVGIGAMRDNLRDTEGWHRRRVPHPVLSNRTHLRDICASCWTEGKR